MKLRAFVASAVIAGFLSGVPALVHADEYHHGWGDYHEHHDRTLVAGGSRIIRLGSECVTRNGLRTAIGMNTIIGMITAGGDNATPNGRMNIIPTGSLELSAARSGFLMFRIKNVLAAAPPIYLTGIAERHSF